MGSFPDTDIDPYIFHAHLLFSSTFVLLKGQRWITRDRRNSWNQRRSGKEEMRSLNILITCLLDKVWILYGEVNSNCACFLELRLAQGIFISSLGISWSGWKSWEPWNEG